MKIYVTFGTNHEHELLTPTGFQTLNHKTAAVFAIPDFEDPRYWAKEYFGDKFMYVYREQSWATFAKGTRQEISINFMEDK